MDKFHYLKIGLGVVLTFVGVKMLLAHTQYKIDTLLSLAIIALILGTSVTASLLRPKHPIKFKKQRFRHSAFGAFRFQVSSLIPSPNPHSR